MQIHYDELSCRTIEGRQRGGKRSKGLWKWLPNCHLSLSCPALSVCLAVSSGFIWSSTRRRLECERRLAVHERIFGSYSAHTHTHTGAHPHMRTLYIYIYQHFIAFIWADNKIPISMKRNKNTYTRQTRTTMEHCGNNESNAKHRVTDKGRRPRLHFTPSLLTCCSKSIRDGNIHPQRRHPKKKKENK